MLPLESFIFITAEGQKCGLDSVVADAFGCTKNEASKVRRSGGIRVAGQVVTQADVPYEDLKGREIEAGERGAVRLDG